MYSPNAAKAKATAVVRQIVADSGRSFSDEQMAPIIDAVAQDLGEGPAHVPPADDTVIIIALRAAKAVKDEM